MCVRYARPPSVRRCAWLPDFRRPAGFGAPQPLFVPAMPLVLLVARAAVAAVIFLLLVAAAACIAGFGVLALFLVIGHVSVPFERQ